MKILIIEDEKHNVSRLQRILLDISPSMEVVGVLGTVKDSVIWLKNEALPDVILMDIRLSDGLSFDIFEMIDVTVPIIFTTSYDEYAVRAFKVNSIDYLLKPIEKEELQNALNKVNKDRDQITPSPELEHLLNIFREKKQIFRKRFLLPRSNGYKTVAVDEIDFIFTENKISYLVTTTGRNEILGLTMDELEDELDPEVFFRANRQFIIHIDSVAMIQNDGNGKLKVVLKQNRSINIIVSREKATSFKNWLDR